MTISHPNLMSQFNVRIARPSDVDDIARLHYRSHTESFVPFVDENWLASLDLDTYHRNWEAILANLDHRNRAWVAEAESKIVGIVRVSELEDDRALLSHMHVMPELIGHGVGSRLMTAALEFMRAAGYSQGQLGVDKGNHRALRFYERFGWQMCGDRDDGEGFIFCIDLRPGPSG